jgi:chemotaxis protein MotB
MMLCVIAPIGCVSTETHTKALTELDAIKKVSAQRAAELEALKKKSQAQADQLQQLQARFDGLEEENGQLNSELRNVNGQVTDLEQKLASGSASAQDEIAKLQKQAAELKADAAHSTKEREQLRQEQSQLTASLELERQHLKAEEAEKARLEQERAAKEEEIKRLTKTQEELSRSLQDEIAKGNITIQQVRDRLTINMVDRILFHSGQAQINQDGIKVLKQVGDVLNKIMDKQIQIEGHTDNVPISTKLQDRFKTNWELSTSRATTVVRYLIDRGGVDRQYLSAVGYADTHPIASNDSKEGRSSNRRIEIVLYPKDLKNIAGQLENSSPTSK